jgi:uncharacterized protein (TIGR02118 family)
MYKVVGYWSAPARAEDIEAFEDEYVNVHVPVATKIPGLQRLVTTRVDSAYGGGEPEHYRIAELIFADKESLEKGLASPEYSDVSTHGGQLVEKYGVKITGELGEETETPTANG